MKSEKKYGLLHIIFICKLRLRRSLCLGQSSILLFSGKSPSKPSMLQFVWTDYDQAFVKFSCYNVTEGICYNYGVAVFSRDQRRLSNEIMKKVHQLHDEKRLCVNRGRSFQTTHTLGMFNNGYKRL